MSTNYKSQLKGWAVDRVIEIAKISNVALDVPALAKQADELAEYAYVPREDLEKTAAELFELLRAAPANEASIDALIGTLNHIKSERIAQKIDDISKITWMADEVAA